MNEPTLSQLVDAADHADWQQVALVYVYGGPCFHFEPERNRFCLRARTWEGHGVPRFHEYVSLGDLLRRIPMPANPDAPGDLNLVERMCEAYCSEPPTTHPIINSIRRGMSAALSVAQSHFEQLHLGDIEDSEWRQFFEKNRTHIDYADVNSFLANRRKRLGKEERVSIRKENAFPTKFLNVFLDGKDQGVQFLEQRDAERYAAGLRAEIALVRSGIGEGE